MPSRTMVVMKLDVVAKHWQALRQLHDPGDNCRDPEFPVPLGGWKLESSGLEMLEINENPRIVLVGGCKLWGNNWLDLHRKNKRIGCDWYDVMMSRCDDDGFEEKYSLFYNMIFYFNGLARLESFDPMSFTEFRCKHATVLPTNAEPSSYTGWMEGGQGQMIMRWTSAMLFDVCFYLYDCAGRIKNSFLLNRRKISKIPSIRPSVHWIVKNGSSCQLRAQLPPKKTGIVSQAITKTQYIYIYIYIQSICSHIPRIPAGHHIRPGPSCGSMLEVPRSCSCRKGSCKSWDAAFPPTEHNDKSNSSKAPGFPISMGFFA